jgi:hypothetical protein
MAEPEERSRPPTRRSLAIQGILGAVLESALPMTLLKAAR